MNPLREASKLLIAVFLFSEAACQPVSRAVEITVAVSGSMIHTPSRPFSSPMIAMTNPTTATDTSTPTLTPYPTFNIQDVKTRTPPVPAECPPEDPDHKTVVEKPDNEHLLEFIMRLDENVLKVLEAGASLRQAAAAFDRAFQTTGMLPLIDLTGDGVPEMIVYRAMFFTNVIGCAEGGYYRLLELDSGPGGMTVPRIELVEDMNLNATPDLIITYQVSTGGNSVVDILEWNGSRFVSRIQVSHGKNSPSTSRIAQALNWYEDYYSWMEIPVMNGRAEITVRDLDGNGTLELILADSGPGHLDTFFSYGPWRGKRMYFSWDGMHYLYYALEMDPPEYRFQAVQDADRFFLLREYDHAIRFYQDVISGKELEWWSPERMEFFSKLFDAKANRQPTPIPPPEDLTEYPRLVAYAALSQQHPSGTEGHPYVVLAERFHAEFRSSGDPISACKSVVEYATADAEILAPLGDKRHGMQSHMYFPEDFCPFP